MLKQKIGLSGLLAAGVIAFSSPAYAFNLLTDCGGPCPYVTYGDGNSYALPINAVIYDSINGGGVGPGNPQYVVSTPGAIKDDTVVATGASGSPVNTNYAGADDAYPTPSGVSGSTYFSTGTVADPTPTFTGDQAGTWDVQLSALQSFMGTANSLIFFFNNNQVNSGASTNQNLAAWAQITITDGSSNVVATYDFTNQGGIFAGIADGGGGDLNGDVSTYTHAGPLDSPLAGTNLATDYVFSGGELCYNTAGGAFLGIVSCSGPHTDSVNMNLGANQAAYAIVFPELDAELASLFIGDVTGYTLHGDVRMGCDPATVDPQTNCVARSLNNGYEQIFIATSTQVVNVPEPSTIALFGLALLMLSFYGFKRRRNV